MKTIGEYGVTSNNGSKTQQGTVSVYKGGAVMARVYCGYSRGKPLEYIRKWPQSPERSDFVQQLLANQVPMADIEMLLTNVAKKQSDK